MKTVLVLAALVALSLATSPPHYEVETKPVNAEFVARQKKIAEFFYFAGQENPEAEYYKVGKDYDIEKHVKDYTNEEYVKEFLTLYYEGFMPKHGIFSIFEERMREEAIALFRLFYFAKDFDTFYNTACFARVHFNYGLFYYSFYMGVFHRPDTQGIVVPAPYEVFPEYFTNMETVYKLIRTKMQDGLIEVDNANYYGIYKEDDYYVYYANYSNYWTYGREEQRLAYFTEDIGWNTYYFYYHAYFPFWMETTGQFTGLKERRGEFYYYFYQQMLARYYLERLSNGLGEIPEFSWYDALKTGYKPFLTTALYPFMHRNDYYYLANEHNIDEIQFLDNYEKTFLQFLQKGHFNAYNHEVNLKDPKSINFVGNYWQANADLYEKSERFYLPSYEHIARKVLGAAPEPLDRHTVAPTALSFYMTSARDPAHYQLYAKIVNYMLQYKEHLEPYTYETLKFEGVSIEDVHVDKLVTYYDYFDYDVTNAVFASKEEFKAHGPYFKVRQPRLNHKPFNVKVDIKSEFEGDAVVKFFLGPKYDSKGYPIHIEDNWMNFFELDVFVHKLTKGQNTIERKSQDFFFFKEDSIPTHEFMKLVEQGKVPVDMSEYYEWLPQRLMLPKGTKGGYPYQLYVYVYKYEGLPKELEEFKDYFVDAKPVGYPFDRPVVQNKFLHSNMHFEDVYVYFEGEYFTYNYNPLFYKHSNEVTKH